MRDVRAAAAALPCPAPRAEGAAAVQAGAEVVAAGRSAFDVFLLLKTDSFLPLYLDLLTERHTHRPDKPGALEFPLAGQLLHRDNVDHLAVSTILHLGRVLQACALS